MSVTSPILPPTCMSKRLRPRHSLVVRATHWINAVCMAALFMSGLQISNAHPALYWGVQSDFAHPLLELPAFPGWATLPGDAWLALGRRWHFFMAWCFVLNAGVFLLHGLGSRHFARDLVPGRTELRGIFGSIAAHLRLRFHAQESRYNPLQKLTYLVVVFGLGPLIVLAGLALSPRLDAGMPWLPALFGGRQSARTIHFLCAFGFLGFVAIHLAMVAASGPWRSLCAMITGRYPAPKQDRPA